MEEGNSPNIRELTDLQRKDEKLLRQQREKEDDDKKKREIKESIEKYKQNVRSHVIVLRIKVRAHNPNGNMNMVRAKKKQLERIDYITIDDVDRKLQIFENV